MFIIFSAQYLETMVICNNQIRFLKFVTLYSCTIELILEELKNIRWIWHQEIRTPYTCFSGIIFTIKCLIQTKFTQQQVNIQHFVNGVLYLFKTDVNWLISMSEKKVPLLLHRSVHVLNWSMDIWTLCLLLLCALLNSLRPSDAIWRWRSWSTLVQVMACCLTAPSHYLNQCRLIISKLLWHSSEDIIIRRFEDTNQ